MEISSLKKKHYPTVAQIYDLGLLTGVASFETRVPTWKQWNKKFYKTCRFVAMVDSRVVAWYGLSPVSKREVYSGVAESTIYVHPEFQGRGIGKYVLKHLILASETAGFWTLQASVFKENTASVNLHKQCGFRVVGVRERIAKRNEVWFDNLLLERRSDKL